MTKNTYNKYKNVVSPTTIWWEIHQKLNWKMMQKIKVSNNWLITNYHMVMRVPNIGKYGVRSWLVYVATHAPSIVKSPNGGTSGSLILEINSQINKRRSTSSIPLKKVYIKYNSDPCTRRVWFLATKKEKLFVCL